MRVLYLTFKTQLRTGYVVYTCQACVKVLGSIPKEREGSERDKQTKTQNPQRTLQQISGVKFKALVSL